MREITYSSMAGNYTRITCDGCHEFIYAWLDVQPMVTTDLGVDLCEKCREVNPS